MADLFNITTGKINEIQNKKGISIYAKIDQVNVQKASNQTDFLNLNLFDETGVINAKKWDITEEEKTAFNQGQLVYLEGVGSEYNGRMQLIIHAIRHVTDFDNVDVSVFYPKAPIDIQELKAIIYQYIGRIKNNHLHLITKSLVDRYEEQYFLYPAATKHHHAYISGLAHHVKTMLELGESYGRIYPEINLDLLFAGIILHDLGKIIELSDHLAPEYTKVGKLIGHINLCFEEIRLFAHEKKLASEEVILLQHLILSHHGLLEYGSPKMPQILEAEVLHLIDLADSRINMIKEELNQIEAEDFTKRVYALDSRSFYKHKLSK
jgi:3'-5' exoribonuclease